MSSEAQALAQVIEQHPVLDAALNQVTAEEKLFELAQRKAQVYAKSELVPKIYQNNVGNVLIAENMARRMGADTLMVMQNLYIVHGNPGWSATFLIASFNSNGRFSAIKYRFKGEVNTDNWGCQAYCTEISTGEEISGTWVTFGMAKAEGWVNKNGSKWKTMPEQMFRYRSATFLIRATAPEIGMGLLTKDELEDMPVQNGDNGHSQTVGVSGVKERLQIASPEEPITDEEPEAVDVETEPIDQTESRHEDLLASAKDIYKGLSKDDKKNADVWLGQRVITDLSDDDLTMFIEQYQ